MLARVVTVALSAILLTVIGTVAHLFLFGITRSAVLPLLFKVPFLSRLLRPFLAHFLRGSFSLALLTKNSGLIFRAFGFGFVNVAIWDFAESLFDLFVVEVSITPHYPAFQMYMTSCSLSTWHYQQRTQRSPSSPESLRPIRITSTSHSQNYITSRMTILRQVPLAERHSSPIRNTTQAYGRPSCEKYFWL